jgi:hypothetical protein
MSIIFWWIRQVVLIVIGAFFLFIMTFFASNFIILISGTLVFGFAYRMVTAFRQSKKNDER